jgi:hypothetical protein
MKGLTPQLHSIGTLETAFGIGDTKELETLMPQLLLKQEDVKLIIVRIAESIS